MKSNEIFVSTFSGNRLYLGRPAVEDVCIMDIAHHLAGINRFNGATTVPYSVAQHCVHVSYLVPQGYELAGLLHDAAEAYLGDMVKPLKLFLGDEYVAMESKITDVIAETFGVNFSDYTPIKRADLVALATEKRDLMPFSTEDWSYLDGIQPDPLAIKPWTQQWAKQAFLNRFDSLMAFYREVA